MLSKVIKKTQYNSLRIIKNKSVLFYPPNPLQNLNAFRLRVYCIHVFNEID